jgi:hypothetical protein
MNNSSRDEIYENSTINLDRLQNEYTNYKGIKITPILDKLLEYNRNWLQHVNRMSCNRLPRVMKHYSPTGRRNHGRPLKRRETGTGQQVAQLHDRYIIIIIISLYLQ